MAGDDSRRASATAALKTFCVSGLGTALEFYDFVIYGMAAALVFPQVFFPSLDRMTATLVAFGAFGAGFLARPIGGVLFGHFGDRFGRERVLVTTLLLMGASSLLIGCLPGYATIGVAAPILLIALRLLQGLAAGGEWGGAALFGIEVAPPGRRGLWGSFTSMGIGVGGIFGDVVFAGVSSAFNDDLSGIAWRIPFWIGGLLVLVGLYARLQAGAQRQAATVASDTHARMPIVDALRRRPRELLLCAGIAFGYITIAYIGSTFFLAYATDLGYGSTQALMFDLAMSVSIVISAPLFAHLSDRIGRRTVMIAGAALMTVGLFTFFPLVSVRSLPLAVLAYVLAGGFMGATQGPIPAFLGEQFPREMRYSGISASYQIGAALGGGTASSAATAILIATHHNAFAVGLYGALALAIVAICSYCLKETAGLSMAEIDAGVAVSMRGGAAKRAGARG
ncbi:MFS transporter [Burkholderia lata]|uniref:Major facilitator superfamily protein n=1 Tax=Burkholderia lata (strain ATCC 17760 / DSM 23089 / LMG 22485 / NCIMB 9086 / R18194 / 383) TaxID=482957 RepID=A0A6P2TER1_BURL3|nr:MFS transporter [Burkholderia lata]VWC62265.1 major facilitator superfamily protein [Burkholderia lata]